MDLTAFLTIGVAVVIALSGYLLFNDMPRPGGSAGPRRASRRS